jgi:uncharacterized protein (TIGR02594 family)
MNDFSFLEKIPVLPKMVRFGLDLMGTTEVVGKGSNPEIMKWAKAVGLDKIYGDDDIAWCGLFIAYLVHLSGRQPVKAPLWARNWAKWGEPVDPDEAKLGDILVFVRSGGGHVGIYIAEDKETFYVLAGNQGNSVSITRIAKNRLLAVRRPAYNSQPESVKKYFVLAGGSISTNEA